MSVKLGQAFLGGNVLREFVYATGKIAWSVWTISRESYRSSPREEYRQRIPAASHYIRGDLKGSCCLSALPRKKNLKLGASLLLTVSTFLPPNPRLVELGYWLLIRKEFTNSYMTAFRTDFECNHLSLKTSVMGISPPKRHLFPNTVLVYVTPVPGAL